MNTENQENMSEDLIAEFHKLSIETKKITFCFRLYIAGANINSLAALKNIKQICEEYLPGKYQLEVIDIYQQPGLASVENLFAIPTLVKELPLPIKKIIGDLSNTTNVLACLNIISE